MLTEPGEGHRDTHVRVVWQSRLEMVSLGSFCAGTGPIFLLLGRGCKPYWGSERHQTQNASNKCIHSANIFWAFSMFWERWKYMWNKSLGYGFPWVMQSLFFIFFLVAKVTWVLRNRPYKEKLVIGTPWCILWRLSSALVSICHISPVPYARTLLWCSWL